MGMFSPHVKYRKLVSVEYNIVKSLYLYTLFNIDKIYEAFIDKLDKLYCICFESHYCFNAKVLLIPTRISILQCHFKDIV